MSRASETRGTRRGATQAQEERKKVRYKHMIKGYDMAHWQSDADFKKGLENAQFMIIKATEGKSMKDSTLDNRMINTDFQALPHGYYHFAHPELNPFTLELENFKKAIGEEYYKEDVLLALDWESKALNCTFDWALAFCNQVFADSGKHCLIYASASVVKKYAKLYNYWWVAHYNYDCMDGCTHCGTDNQYIVQFSSRPVDTNALLKPWKFTDDNVTIGEEPTRIYPRPKFNRKERYFNEYVDYIHKKDNFNGNTGSVFCYYPFGYGVRFIGHHNYFSRNNINRGGMV